MNDGDEQNLTNEMDHWIGSWMNASSMKKKRNKHIKLVIQDTNQAMWISFEQRKSVRANVKKKCDLMIFFLSVLLPLISGFTMESRVRNIRTNALFVGQLSRQYCNRCLCDFNVIGTRR